MAAILACGPGPPPEKGLERGAALPIPYDLRAEASNGRATLFWSVDRDDGVPISGYNIYFSEISVSADTLAWVPAPDRPYNGVPYPGDTDGDISLESFDMEGLTDGSTYAVVVRTVGPDGRLSAPSNMGVFTPLGRGAFVISADHLAENGGFNFGSGAMVTARDPRCDIYLYATERAIGLSSPSRLGAGLRKTRFFPNGENDDSMETIAIAEGDAMALKTRDGLVEIRIIEILGRYPDVSAKIEYVFRPVSR